MRTKPVILALVSLSFFSQALASPICSEIYSTLKTQSPVQRSTPRVTTPDSSQKIKRKIRELAELIKTEEFSQAKKRIKTFIARLNSEGKPYEITEKEAELLVRAFEAKYDKMPIHLLSHIMGLYGIAKFRLDPQNLELWSNAYVAKLNRMDASNIDASLLVNPMRAFRIANYPAPEATLKAIHSIIVNRGRSMEFSLNDVYYIVSGFATVGGFRVDPYFRNIMDTHAAKALEGQLSSAARGDFNPYVMVKIFVSFRKMQRTPSDKLVEMWEALEPFIIERINQDGRRMPHIHLELAMEYARTQGGRYTQPENIDFMEGLNEY